MAIGGYQPVAVAAGVGHDGHRRARASADAWAAAGEVCVAKGEDTTIGGDHEVAPLVVAGHHADDRRVEPVGEPEPAGWRPSPGIDP